MEGVGLWLLAVVLVSGHLGERLVELVGDGLELLLLVDELICGERRDRFGRGGGTRDCSSSRVTQLRVKQRLTMGANGQIRWCGRMSEIEMVSSRERKKSTHCIDYSRLATLEPAWPSGTRHQDY